MLLNPADSVLFYSQQTREANNTVRSTIKLRCNKTRRMANKTGVVSLRVQRLWAAFLVLFALRRVLLLRSDIVLRTVLFASRVYSE